MTLRERIKELCRKNNVSINKLESELGFGKGYISKLDKSMPNTEKMSLIANYFGVTLDFLLNGDIDQSIKSKGIRIPVYGRVAAGIPLEMIEDIDDFEEIPDEMAKHGEYFALRIHGASMEPRMQEGDVVIVRRQEDAETGETIIVTVNGSEATCKRLKKYHDGIELISTNPSCKPQFFTAQQVIEKPVRILGKVVELRAKF